MDVLRGQDTRRDLSLQEFLVCCLPAVLILLAAVWLFEDVLAELQGSDRPWACLAAGVVVAIPGTFVVLAGVRRGWRVKPLDLHMTCVLIAIGTSWVAAFGALVEINARFDHSPPQEMEWLVVDVMSLSESRPRVVLALSKSPDERTTARIPRDLAAQLVPGQSHLVLTFQAGALGWLRVVNARALPLPVDFDAGATRLALTAASDTARSRAAAGGHIVWRIVAGCILLLVVVGIGAVLVAIWRRPAVLARTLRGRRRWLGVTGRRDGIEFSVSDGWLRLLVPARALVVAVRHDSITRLLVSLGLVRPCPSGDPAFDHDVLVEARPPEVGRDLVSSPEARALLAELLREPGYDARVVRLDESGLRASCPSGVPRAMPADALLARLMALHPIIVRSVGARAASPRVTGRALRTAKVVFAIALVAGFPFFFMSLLEVHRMDELLRSTVWWSLVPGAVALSALLWLRWQRASSPKLIGGMLLVVPLIAWTATLEGACLLNRVLDGGPEQQVETRVVGHRGKMPLLAAWDEEGDVIAVDSEWWGLPDLEPSARVIVRLRPGGLGYARIVGLATADS